MEGKVGSPLSSYPFTHYHFAKWGALLKLASKPDWKKVKLIKLRYSILYIVRILGINEEGNTKSQTSASCGHLRTVKKVITIFEILKKLSENMK